MKCFENKIALVTSSTKGIGLACALKLARGGAHVYMGVRRPDAAEEICVQHPEYQMTPVFFDGTQTDSYETMIEEIIKKSERIDILINNFGVGRPAVDLDLVNGSEEAFFDLLHLNLGSVYRLCKLTIPHMIKSGGGNIVNISSIGGLIADITRIGYGVSKAAINNITQQIALQYARNNIRCNAVLPGLTATEAAMKNMPEDFLKSFLSHVPLGRMANPEDIADAAAFFACDASSYITGHILDVAGGYGLGTPQYADSRS
ncbi:SDR family oxidoreductase [Ihubacter massiliensis]|uniref:SDR family oxidoreductase n=1 Tax=Hominibacterium faecale TaxID=2839743 RepID=A0A9J6QLX9_9FIRM|nr:MULTISPECIES: SDR family oxidoreductase [Eubacteriales Family XIII. Incertae Sedis]MCI7300227.1 SDR family oxidoreductase [Clostridia bacterium]MDE8734286.1 SDR family NAD(P)-dependent oxidoreductase [Eubacteriales bacterium DFI.9.88]MDY3010238.1 SDR family oxidoreductase [Clostridiales Family XIII bacterium]MCO7121486.1 SDR family oxidoreductase [Ihubacter massiliensis]MCU7378472.1 SDR family oxidoreductase [Hominibacterium faecale]